MGRSCPPTPIGGSRTNKAGKRNRKQRGMQGLYHPVRLGVNAPSTRSFHAAPFGFRRRENGCVRISSKLFQTIWKDRPTVSQNSVGCSGDGTEPHAKGGRS